ncbi:MAG: PD40 domain-containing protein [Bryobacterales bacterium]|nr:PD40 domain-containing protein [Bryobacterales bacterium]
MKSMLRALAHAWTRRRFLAAGAAAAAFSDDRMIPSERVRFVDGTTEFEVSRVTTPTHTSLLPPPHVRMFSRRGPVSLLFASDHGGSMQAHLLDLKTWQSRVLTEAAALDPASLCLSPDDRLLCYRDAQSLRVLTLGATRQREAYKFPDDTPAGVCVQVLPEGPSALLVESKKTIKLVNLVRGDARKVCDFADGVLDPVPRPRRASIVFRTGIGGLVLAHLDGSRTVPLKTAAGAVGPARWSPDGRTVLYLHFPDPNAKTSHLREINPDTGEDRLVATTSQFVQFSPNGDASVFVGASGSKAQPHILLLLRSVRRELTICEHRCSNPATANPVFSPDSQRIFFQSDRQGKPAIYAMSVERLVEKTETQ